MFSIFLRKGGGWHPRLLQALYEQPQHSDRRNSCLWLMWIHAWNKRDISRTPTRCSSAFCALYLF